MVDRDSSIIKTDKSSILKIFSGSKKFIFGINDLLNKIMIKSGKIVEERENLWLLRITNVDDIKRLYSLIYKNSENFYYPRKERIWRQYI